MAAKIFSLKKLRRLPSTDPATIEIQDNLEALQESPLLNGKLVIVTIPASQQQVTAQHNLGKRYIGALPAGQSSALIDYRVFTPDRTAQAGFDPEYYVTVYGSTTSGNSQTVQLWVFG